MIEPLTRSSGRQSLTSKRNNNNEIFRTVKIRITITTQIFIFILFLLFPSTARKGFGPGDQEWGYVEVRHASHMFWWLYYTTANVSSYYDKPLIIWLQGGPGASSTSYGNFEELGPLDADLNPRNFSWVGSAI